MAQTTIDITKIKDRDTATALNTVGTIFEAGTFSGTASVVAGTASREVTISVAANLVKLVNSGTDADIGTVITPKGAGVVALGGTTVANSGVQVPIVTSSVNFLKVSGGATGTGVTVLANGTDGTVDLRLQSTSTGVVALGGTTTANASTQIVTTASSVNFLRITGGATGSGVALLATGTDGTVDLQLQSKSTGVVALGGPTTANASAQAATVASSVNFLQLQGAIATAGPILTATGTDPNVALNIRTKGTGVVYIGGSSIATAGLQVASTASAVNNIIITNAATGSAPSIAIGGTGADANRNLTISAIGTAAVVMGNNLARTAVTTISAAGTTRADATQLTADVTKLTTVGANTGVILPTGIVGMSILIENGGASVCKVYANGSETIDGTAGSTGVSLTNAKRCIYYFIATNTWISAQMGVVSG